MKELYIAGGCFWGVQQYYMLLKGVIKTETGYANGLTENPTYHDVLTGKTGHAEVVYLTYDPKVISLHDIIEHFFRFINPYSLNKQGNDIGVQYRSGLYYVNQDDKLAIEHFIRQFEKTHNKKTVIEVEKLKNYHRAEEEHQFYLCKKTDGYCHIDLSLIKEEEKR